MWAAQPPIRVRQNIPDCWIELIIREGRNRQVRRMTAAVGHSTPEAGAHGRGAYSIDGLEPGQWLDVLPLSGSAQSIEPLQLIFIFRQGRCLPARQSRPGAKATPAHLHLLQIAPQQ
jgi:hypothetical protein